MIRERFRPLIQADLVWDTTFVLYLSWAPPNFVRTSCNYLLLCNPHMPHAASKNLFVWSRKFFVAHGDPPLDGSESSTDGSTEIFVVPWSEQLYQWSYCNDRSVLPDGIFDIYVAYILLALIEKASSDLMLQLLLYCWCCLHFPSVIALKDFGCCP